MTVTLHQGDCLDHMAAMDANSVDTIICDPPYGLEFMGKEWDHGVPGVPFWQAALRVAKPGALLLAFGGTRTHHRLMCAIEDAGWEIRDTMMWLYGSGFPKSFDISKGIDKAAGATREVVGRTSHYCEGRERSWGFSPEKGWNDNENGRDNGTYATAPATPDAATWHGWGTALKPAWEPIIVAQKPTDGGYVHNALTWGVAGLWVEGARIEGAWTTWRRKDGTINPSAGFANEYVGGDTRPNDVRNPEHPAGRWPANVVLSHTPECRQVGTKRVRSGNSLVQQSTISTVKGGLGGKVGQHYADADGLETVEAWECSADCPVRLLDGQSGVTRPGHHPRTATNGGIWGNGKHPKLSDESNNGFGDTGGASRFLYQAKSSRSERNAGISGVSLELEVCLCDGNMELVASLEKAISASVTDMGTHGCSTTWNGNGTTEPFHRGTLSITSTETSKTTPLKTWNASTSLPTSGFILAVIETLQAAGSSLVASAAHIAQSLTSMSERAESVRGVKTVVSETPLRISASAAPTVNFHPTCKPVALLRYLCRLTRTPTGGVVYDPFLGSGSTGIAAVLEGRDFIGSEIDADYFEIARRRIEHARRQLALPLVVTA